MRKVFEKVVKFRKSIFIVFVLLAIIGGILSMLVTVNYDLIDYLPKDAQSTKAIDIMFEEFPGETPNTRVMISDVSVFEALEYKKALLKIPGISYVGWLDDAIEEETLLSTPIEYLDEATRFVYYKDNKALYSVAIESGKETPTIEAIYELIGEENRIAGDAVNAGELQNMTSSEVIKAVLFIIPLIIIILALSTSSWFEPVIYLITIGVAVLINMGTMAFYDNISFITQTVTPVLQLAVSLDYAIFLLHSFRDHKEKHDSREAMILAMKDAFTSVAASAATTVIGFLALIFMRFRIGTDLGLHLAKGVVLSFLSVMVFLPVFTLLSERLINKTRHKNILPSFSKMGKALMKTRIPLMVIALVIALPCYLAQANTAFFYGSGDIVDGSSRALQDVVAINEEFGEENLLVLLVNRDNPGREKELCEELEKIPRVKSVVSYATLVGSEITEEYLSTDILSQFYSENYGRILLYVDAKGEGEETFELISTLLDKADEYYDEVYMAGHSATLYDMAKMVTRDTRIVNLIAIAGIFIVILIAFKSLSIPVLLVFTIETAIWINLSIAFFTDSPLSFIGYLIISTVQLGATVDYAILMANNYLSNRQSFEKKEAMHKTLTDNLAAILVSAGILSAAGFTLQATSSNPIIKELGLLLGRGTILSFVMVVGVLPALLVVFDKVIKKTTFKNGFYKKKKEQTK